MFLDSAALLIAFKPAFYCDTAMKNALALGALETARNEDLAVKMIQERTDGLDSAQLFQGKKLINIIHDGECYQLRITRQNKLLLTKPGVTAF